MSPPVSLPHPWVAPQLRDMPVDRLDFWNALISRTGEPLPLRDRAAAIVELGPVPADDALCCDLRLGPELRLILHPVDFPFVAAFGAGLVVADLPCLPETLRAALLTGLVETCAAALPDHGWGAVTIRRSAPLSALAPIADLRWFRVAIRDLVPEPIRLDLGASLDTLFEIFNPIAPRAVWPELSRILTRTAFVTLGRLALPIRTVRTLVPGSVVVLDETVSLECLRLRLGSAMFHVRSTEAGWTCTAVTSGKPRRDPDETAMSMSSEALEPTTAADLDVVLDLDIGSVTVPLAEIETWRAGSLLALDPERPRDGLEVVLRANGRPIGTGELVQIDDRLAVRILRIALA